MTEMPDWSDAMLAASREAPQAPFDRPFLCAGYAHVHGAHQASGRMGNLAARVGLSGAVEGAR